MNEYPLSQIASCIGAKVPAEYASKVVSFLSIDSRKIDHSPATLFFALQGVQKDGHTYIREAYNKGIRYFVVSTAYKIIEDELEEVVFLRVPNVLRALQELAIYHRTQHDLTCIGITGSNGKTIVKEWLTACLMTDFKVVKSPKSYNSQIGVPLSIWQIQPTDEIGIFEAGISQPGEMARLQQIIRPTIGLLTHIGVAHSENFTSKEEILTEKLKLFSQSSVIIHGMQEKWMTQRMVETYPDKPTLCWGYHALANLCLSTKERYETETLVTATYKKTVYHFAIPFTDKVSIENCLTIILTLLYLAFSEERINSALALLRPVKMRLEILEGIHDTMLISDVYNSDFDSVTAALEMLVEQKYPKKTLILSAFEGMTQAVFELIEKANFSRVIFIGVSDLQIPLFVESYEDLTAFFAVHTRASFSQEAVLVKGARKYALERVVTWLTKRLHETVLEINLEYLVHNLNFFRSKLKPQTRLMAMVKASSYGSGMYEIANILDYHQIDYLGVAYPDEGLNLRQYGIQTPIMVMNPTIDSFQNIITHDLEPEIYSFRTLEAFVQKVKALELKKYPIHLKIDTGMHRLGFEKKVIPLLIQQLEEYDDWLQIQSIFSHLATSDMMEEEAFTLSQIQLFSEVYTQLTMSLNIQPIKHILNSAGIVNFSAYQFDMVRLGVGLYGYSGDPSVRQHLKSIGCLKSVISQIKQITEGESVGYTRNTIAAQPITIATIPIGYADGISRLQGNRKGYVTIHDQRAEIVGNICMDMLMVDVSAIECEEGDQVIIFGESPQLEELAQWQETIVYEVLTSISSRVKRLYFKH